MKKWKGKWGGGIECPVKKTLSTVLIKIWFNNPAFNL